ncbi:MAG TPA: ROK family protein [Solirubrobacterales bacterium]|nr:ROK family protein [Solirubrobacterales bacterium]
MSARETIGIDLGGTKMLIGVVDADRKVHYEDVEPSTGLSEDELVGALARELEEAKDARPGVLAAGLGIPATIDRRRGVAIQAVNLEISDVPVRDLMRERLGLPVFLDNDANVAALAEHLYGAGRGAQNMVMLTLGTGIGGGLILGGEVYRGSTGAGTELGHIVINEDGPRCQGNCPNRGCVETYASGTAIAREGTAVAEREPDSALGRALAEGPIVGRTVTELARSGDPQASEVVAEAGRHLGVAIASLANIFDPEVIVVGGGVSAVGDMLLDPAREELAARALPPMNRTQVKLAELGPDAGMIGAAAMALIELDKGA